MTRMSRKSKLFSEKQILMEISYIRRKTFNSKRTRTWVDFLEINCKFMFEKSLKVAPEEPKSQTFLKFSTFLTHFFFEILKDFLI